MRDRNPAAIQWAIDAPVEKASAYRVLIVLARFANEEFVAWPTQETLGKHTRLSRSAVRDALAALVAAGYVLKMPSQTSDRYHLLVPAECRNPTNAMVEIRPMGGRKSSGRKSTTGASSGRNPTITTSSKKQVSRNPSDSRVPPPSGSDAPVIKVGLPRRANVGTPGFEEEPSALPVRKSRRVVDDGDDLGGVGKVESDEPAEVVVLGRPVERWGARNLVDYFVEQAEPHGGVEQTNQGFAGKDFKRWLQSGISPVVLRDSINAFFDDPAQTREIGTGPTLYMRYRNWWIANQARLQERAQRKTAPAPAVDTTAKAYRDFMEN